MKKKLLAGLATERFYLSTCESTPGGGSLPGKVISSWGVVISDPVDSENQMLGKLRGSTPPVIGRIHEGKVIIDCRTVLPHQVDLLRKVLQAL